MWNDFWNWLDIKLGFAQPPVAPTPVPVTIPSTTVQSVPTTMTPLEQFCTYITNFEGGIGDPNHINNNPGDFRYFYGGYLPKYGVVKESAGGFAVFETWQLGWEYLLASVTEMCEHHPEWNFLDFFAVYAPTKDNNDPVHYASVVASEMMVEPTANVKSTLKL